MLATIATTDSTARALDKEQQCLRAIAAAGPARIAFSGGVDSLYLLALAHEALGDRVTAITADSASLPRALLAEAKGFTATRGIRHIVMPSDEFANPAYVANDGARCYHCKSSLMDAALTLERAGVGGLVYLGVIADDLSEHRPGMQAAQERGARFPLADAGFTKADVRARSQARYLPGWDRPAAPCLSSRVPYGEPVTREAVRMIEAAEAILYASGFAACRARHHAIGRDPEGHPRGWLCRIEVPAHAIAAVAAQAATLAVRIRAVGYANVSLDLAGLRSGGFNDLLPLSERLLPAASVSASVTTVSPPA